MAEKKIDVDLAIRNVINKIKQKPFIIHLERDIQAMLYSELLSHDDGTYPTSTNIYNLESLETNRVHCEYQFSDLVVFNVNHIKNINHSEKLLYVPSKNDWIYCDALIEMKFGNRKGIEKEKIKNDFEVLRFNQDKIFE